MKTLLKYPDYNTFYSKSPITKYNVAICENLDHVYLADIYYDSKVEYLEPTVQGAYIDLGIKPTLTTGLEVKVRCPAIGTDNSKETIWFGASGNAAYKLGNNFCIEKGSTNKNINIVCYNTSSSGTMVLKSNYTGLANPYIIYFNYNGNKQGILYNADKTSTLATVNNMTVSTIPTNLNLYLFCRNVNGSPDATYNYITRIYYLKLWQGTELVRDMIPIRIGTTYYMYDKVSKGLFGNAGTGSFTGPDII